MVYKSRKNKRRRNFRRQTRSKMYGGAMPPQYDNKVPNVPNLSTNVSKATNLISSATSVVADKTLDKVGELGKSIGIDPEKGVRDNIEHISDLTGEVVDVLNSPEGEKLKEEASQLAAEIVDISAPSVEKATEILSESVDKLTKSGTEAVINAAGLIPPIQVANELSKLATVGAQAGQAVSELTTTGAEAVENLQEQKEKALSIYTQFQKLLNDASSKANEKISGIIDSATTKVNDYGKMNNTLKQYRQQATMVGGRVKNSYLDFLNNGTKRNNNSNRNKSKRRKR